METDSEIEEARDILAGLMDDLVYDDETFSPEDAFFVCRLLEEHYKAAAEDEFGSQATCEFAWTLAREIASKVDEDPEFDWLNAYFVITGVVGVTRKDLMEYDDSMSWDAVDEPEHFDGFDPGDSGETADRLADGLDDIAEHLDLYVDLDEPSEGALGKCQYLSTTFSSLSKRYAHEFHYEMMESYASFELTELLIEYKEDDSISNREMLNGGRMVEHWLEHRAKRVHAALCMTGEA